MSSKRIIFTRHAQAEHNVVSDWTILDAPLTVLGKQQSRELHEMTKDSYQQTAELLVSSPLRRPMETMLLGYPTLQQRLEATGKPVILLDILQEVEDHPCDTPLHPSSKLAASNGGIFSGLDFSTLSSDYSSKKGIYAPDQAPQRAKRVRQWLRARPETEIVAVAHGDILRNIVDGKNSQRQWANAEVKVFAFVSNDDENAMMKEIQIVKPDKATTEPTSSEM